MEVIRLSGYTEDEKMNIAVKYLLPKQLKATGLKEGERVVGVRFDSLVQNRNRDLADNRASGRIDKPSSRRARRQFLQRTEESAISLKMVLLVQHGVDDHVALFQLGTIGFGLGDIAVNQPDLLHP